MAAGSAISDVNDDLQCTEHDSFIVVEASADYLVINFTPIGSNQYFVQLVSVKTIRIVNPIVTNQNVYRLTVVPCFVITLHMEQGKLFLFAIFCCSS